MSEELNGLEDTLQLLRHGVLGGQERIDTAVARTESPPGWDHPRFGEGNWAYAPVDAPQRIGEIAAQWSSRLRGVERPWLCWCVDDDWSLLQQRLVRDVGWTPVVGGDGTVKTPASIDGAVVIDFAGDLGVVKLRPHFVIEFAFLFCPRLAYWHSDVLLPMKLMRTLADQFGTLHNGEHCGVTEGPTLGMLWERWRKGQPLLWKRIFEVVGCTTAAASRSQYASGCGIWRNTRYHPMAGKATQSKPPYYEFGVGIYRWVQENRDKFREVDLEIEPYHFSQINNSAYGRIVDSRDQRRFKGREMQLNFDLRAICDDLGIGDLYSASAMDGDADLAT
ncbi:hypothetical protein [Roseiconus lacunae]|uniref:Uncharacterized protein n=1 Tax=Roseiconus lacunae TaxID=2605694 RepID=A0ABT7PRE4_9BACT|nr:hypothetical protein [Roseiconus lacunae]MDM4018844.1 hypothetical protein [Roseiconus lacunae]